MQTLSTEQTLMVNGGVYGLQPEQTHYLFQLGSQGLARLALQAQIGMSATPEGAFVNYVVIPAVHILATAAGSVAHNLYYGSK